MEFEEVLKMVYSACEKMNARSDYAKSAIIKSATDIFLSDKNIFITNEKDKIKDMQKVFEEYEKYLLDSSESYHDYNIKVTVLNDIKAHFNNIFEHWQ